ncbi:MAG: hypothetical protein AAGA48_35605 [Myxococcota bacterium]
MQWVWDAMKGDGIRPLNWEALPPGVSTSIRFPFDAPSHVETLTVVSLVGPGISCETLTVGPSRR